MEPMNFFVLLQNQGMHRGYNLKLEKMFSGTKSDFSEVWSISGGKYRIAMTHSLLEGKICDVISLKVEKPIT